MTKTGLEIVEIAKSFRTYKYWYGGKRQIASKGLADSLRAIYPDHWTKSYYETALKDVDGKTRVCDCSGLVCKAYGISDIGSSQMKGRFKEYKGGNYVPGMIAWKNGHVAVIIDEQGHVAEMASQASDYLEHRTFKEAGFTAILYSDEVDYFYAYDKGWHQDDHGWWFATGTHKGEYIRNDWLLRNHHWYYFGDDGYQMEGLFQDKAGNWYYGDEMGIWHQKSEKGNLELWEVD